MEDRLGGRLYHEVNPLRKNVKKDQHSPRYVAIAPKVDKEALYDTEQASVGSPQLTLGTHGPGAVLAARSPVVRQLGSELARRFRAEFAQQSARIALGPVHSSPAGDHYLQLHARATARFGGEGQAGADIRALYDTRSGDWLQLDYDLVDRS